MKKLFSFIFITILIIAGIKLLSHSQIEESPEIAPMAIAGIKLLSHSQIEESPEIAPMACSTDTKMCPDGSTVVRTGLNCEFAQCPLPPRTDDIKPITDDYPVSKKTGTLHLHISNSTCILYDAGYGAMAYQSNCSGSLAIGGSTYVEIIALDTGISIAQGNTDFHGNISFELPEGEYRIQGGNANTKCSDVEFQIDRGAVTDKSITCSGYEIPRSN